MLALLNIFEYIFFSNNSWSLIDLQQNKNIFSIKNKHVSHQIAMCDVCKTMIVGKWGQQQAMYDVCKTMIVEKEGNGKQC